MPKVREEGEINRQNRVFREGRLFSMILQKKIHVNIHLSKPIEYAAPRMNHKVSYGLGVMMMCQCRFISHNKWIVLVEDVDNRGGYACVGARVVGNFLFFMINFVMNIRFLSKIKSIFRMTPWVVSYF